MNHTSDRKMIDLLQSNPSEGMTLLMEEYMGLLWSACSSHLNNKEDIRDCVQDTLVDFYEHMDRFDAEKGSLKAYLYIIAKRKAMRMVPRNGQSLETLSEDVALTEDWTENLVTQTALNEALEKLDEQDSEMIRMKYYNGMTCVEIAEAMGLPYETVKKRQQRNLKKLRYILVAVLLFALLTACAVAVVYRYRFSTSTGFQEETDEIWREMVDPPLVVQTKYGEVLITSVVWKEEKVILSAEYTNNELKNEEYEIKIYTNDGTSTKSTTSFSMLRCDDENSPVHVKCEYIYTYIDAQDEYSFEIFGEKYTVAMQPIGQYEYFQDIGSSQTHMGRTIVLQTEETGNETNINAYVYSENVWKIIGLGGWRDYTWNRVPLADSYAFEYLKDVNEETDSIIISKLSLISDGETPILEFEIPEESAKADIPFYMGKDLYRISEIRVSRDTYLYEVSNDEGENIQEYGDELFITIEPVEIETGTMLYGAQVTLGERYKNSTLDGDVNFQYITDNMFDVYFLNENLEPAESVICLGVRDLGELPEKLLLRIDHLYKFWEQEYCIELK